MKFDTPDLATALRNESDATINNAPFGIVEIDATGTIITYNSYEAELAGLAQENALGKNLYTEIAPCTNNFMVANELITAAEHNDTLDKTLDYVFTYKLKPTKVKLRLISQAGRHWMCVEK